jgi:hypothetical protein
MAAGLGFKTFNSGDVLNATDVNGYLMQGVLVFATTAARDAAITSPQEGQFAFTKDTDQLWYRSSSAWVASGATGDIEGVTAGTGISGGGTSGTVTVTNSMATAIDAKGDLIVGTGADAFSRLAVGATNGHVLTVDSAEATGLKYAAAGGASPNWALVSTTATTSGSSISITGLGSYKSILVLATGISFNGTDQLTVQVNGSSTGNYFQFGLRADGTTFNGDGGSNQTLWSMCGGPAATTMMSSLSLNNCQTTGFKTGLIIGGDTAAGTGSVQQNKQIMWANSATVSSLTFATFGSSFDAGSIAIYGSTV